MQEVEHIAGAEHTAPAVEKLVTSEEIQQALIRWNGSFESKSAVQDYMTVHGRERGTAQWLKEAYDGGDDAFAVTTGHGTLELPWSRVQRNLWILVNEGRFLTEADRMLAQPTEIQQSMVQELSERAAKVHSGSVDASVDNMLRITTDGRKPGLDQRIINPDLPDDPNSKVNQCVGNIYRIWDEGQENKLTQLVFCDLSTPKTGAPAAKAAKTVAGNLDSPELHAVESQIDASPEQEFTVYDDIREKLLFMGIPQRTDCFYS